MQKQQVDSDRERRKAGVAEIAMREFVEDTLLNKSWVGAEAAASLAGLLQFVHR